jgi:hypothetical protein
LCPGRQLFPFCSSQISNIGTEGHHPSFVIS